MGFFHYSKKFILGFFFLGLTAEDRIFLRWGYMLSPRGERRGGMVRRKRNRGEGRGGEVRGGLEAVRGRRRGGFFEAGGGSLELITSRKRGEGVGGRVGL